MKDNYELKGPRLKFNYAERMKNGYSVNINFESAESLREYIAGGKADALMADSRLKSISFTIQGNIGSDSAAERACQRESPALASRLA